MDPRRFIAVFKRAQHWTLSWAIWIYLILHILESRFNISLPLRLDLSSGGPFAYDFQTKIVYAFLVSPMRTTYNTDKTHLPLGDRQTDGQSPYRSVS